MGHGSAGPAPSIESMPDASLPKGTVVVTVQSEGMIPLPGAVVTLRETVQNIAEGDAKREQVLRTGPDGSVRFEGIDSSIRAIARVSVHALGADYSAPDFQPGESSGQRIVVPVFAATADPAEAMVGMRGFVYVQLREGEFVFDVLFRVFSLGRKTWVPSGVHLDLPSGLSALESATPAHLTPDGSHGARLAGSFPPGQADVRLNFRMPAGRAETEVFPFSLPPHVAEMRVITEYAPGMSLHVPGFEPVQEARGPEGTRVLVTRRALSPGDGQLSRLEVELRGLPTVGPERWIAVSLAAALAAAGLWAARRSPGRGGLDKGDRKQARQLLLADLAALEKAKASGDVGPQTYERARRELLVALARLEEPERAVPSSG